jgi:uncharacterized protein YraI
MFSIIIRLSATTKCRRIYCNKNVYEMKRKWFKFCMGVLVGVVLGMVMFFPVKQAQAYQDASAVTITVTYTDPINVRGGPSTVYYPIVGRMFPGDTARALGTSPGREWVQIEYPSAPNGVGWVYAIYVSVTGGELSVVEAPFTPTPEITATLDPTLAAAFNFEPTPTRMPTFTPPPPLVVPQFTEALPVRSVKLAPGVIALSLIVLGAAGLLMSFVFRK